MINGQEMFTIFMPRYGMCLVKKKVNDTRIESSMKKLLIIIRKYLDI